MRAWDEGGCLPNPSTLAMTSNCLQAKKLMNLKYAIERWQKRLRYVRVIQAGREDASEDPTRVGWSGWERRKYVMPFVECDTVKTGE